MWNLQAVVQWQFSLFGDTKAWHYFLLQQSIYITDFLPPKNNILMQNFEEMMT